MVSSAEVCAALAIVLQQEEQPAITELRAALAESQRAHTVEVAALREQIRALTVDTVELARQARDAGVRSALVAEYTRPCRRRGCGREVTEETPWELCEECLARLLARGWRVLGNTGRTANAVMMRRATSATVPCACTARGAR
jgi:hypothetical protein